MTDAQSQRWIGGVSFVLILCLLSGWIGRCTCPHEKAVVGASTVDVRRVPYPVDVPRLVYRYLPAKVTVVPTVKQSLTLQPVDIPDTLRCPDFIAEADTTIDSNHLYARYESATAQFYFDLKQKPLVAMVPEIRIKETTHEKRAWWIDALMISGAASLGYGIGKVLD